MSSITGCYFNVVGFPVARFCAELDEDRLQAWIDAAPGAPPPLPDDSEPCDPLAPIISVECLDEDECGLPCD